MTLGLPNRGGFRGFGGLNTPFGGQVKQKGKGEGEEKIRTKKKKEKIKQ